MKKIILIPLFFSLELLAQTGYVSSDNPVYLFLERMENQHLIENYNSFEIPKTRRDISNYLKEVIKNSDQLNQTDKRILEEFKTEFEYEIFGTLENSTSLIGKKDYDFFSDKEKYFFYINEEKRANLFINLIAEGEGIFLNDQSNSRNLSTVHGKLGGEIRGTFLNNFGFFLRGSQGEVFGNKNAAFLRKEISYNFKYEARPDEGFYDETYGYAAAEFDFLKFKFGRDRLNLGYGSVKSFLSSTSPLFDHLQFNIQYKFFTFSFFHGKLLGEKSAIEDSVTGGMNAVSEKYLGYHRIGFNISPHFDFGLGEIIVYGDRGIDLSYLNPFAFYKSVEHSNQDRDNSMLFADYNNNSIKGLKFYASLLFDDIMFSKFGTGWWGNQSMFNAGIYSTNLYNFLPLDIRFEYLRISPYTFTHRFIRNNYTHSGFSLNPLQPNSELFFIQFNYRFNQKLSVTADYTYTLHGANIINDDGSVTNYGGDINLGHRLSDPLETKFLEGDLEYYRNISLMLTFEPYNQVYFLINIIYLNNDLNIEQSRDEFQSFITLKMKL